MTHPFYSTLILQELIAAPPPTPRNGVPSEKALKKRPTVFSKPDTATATPEVKAFSSPVNESASLSSVNDKVHLNKNKAVAVGDPVNSTPPAESGSGKGKVSEGYNCPSSCTSRNEVSKPTKDTASNSGGNTDLA